jgi:hypothetical protein
MTDRQSIAVQVRKARSVVDGWPTWKQEALERQINSRRASRIEQERYGEGDRGDTPSKSEPPARGHPT